MGDRQDGRPWARRRWVGRAVVAAAIPVGLVTGNSQPAFAVVIPPVGGPNTAPDAGSDPIASLPLVFPQPAAAAEQQLPADAIGPLATEIITESSTTQRLGEQVKAIEDELAVAKSATETARQAWDRAQAALEATRIRIDPAPSGSAPTGPSSSESASASPSVGSSPSDAGTPVATPSGTPTPAGSESGTPTGTPADALTTSSSTSSSTASPAPSDTSDARLSGRGEAIRTERDARAALAAAEAVEREIAARHAVVNEQFVRHQTALQILKTRNADHLAAAERQRDAYEVSLAASRGASTNVAGLQANPNALAAVEFALRQLGKPYVWADEGPDSYDCSGLVLASYLSVGVKLPRIANTQYGAGEPVLASQLLPGDLVFFSTSKADWRAIHHVAIYIGDNKVVHAPTFGDVVKVSPIWWTSYFGASRILPAAPVPGVQPPPATADPAAPSPSPTGSQSSSPTSPPVTTQPPQATPTTTTAPATTAPATTAPATTAPTTPQPTPDPTPTATATSTPTPSPSPQPTTSPVPAVSPTSSAQSVGRRRGLFRR